MSARRGRGSSLSAQIPPVRLPDPSKTKWAVWIPIVVSVMTLVGGGVGWAISQWTAYAKEAQQKIEAQKAEDARLIRSYLEPLRAKLKLSASVYSQLADQFVPSCIGILEWYADRAKSSGADKLTLPFGMLTDIVQNNSEMLALIDAYSADALTPAFKAETDRFREHAHTYAIRFKALPTIIVSGEPLPSWKVFPAGLPSALDEEIAARQKHQNEFRETGSKLKFERKFVVSLRTGFQQTPPFCDNVATSLRQDYSNGTFKVLESNELASRRGSNFVFRGVEYSFICKIQVTVIDEY